MTIKSLPVAVVGGGPAGFAAARRLQGAGAEVVLYEAEEWLGGRTRTDRLDGFSIDAGAQLFGSMFTRFFALARDAGIEDRLTRTAGRDALWRDGRAHEVVYGSVASMLASGGLPWRTKMRLGSTYVPFLQRHTDALDIHAPELAAAAGLDRESIAQWGGRTMDHEFTEYLVYPQLSAYYGALPEETSSGLYHTLAHYGIDVKVYALGQGAGSFCETLSEQLSASGGIVRTGQRVAAVEVTTAETRVTTADRTDVFAGVVVATPAPVAADLLQGIPAGLTEWLREVRFRPSVTLALMLDQPLNRRFFGLSFARASARSVVAACVEERKHPDLVPGGKGLLVAFARPDVAPKLIDEEPRAILDAMLPDLRLAFPGIDERATRARLYRWPIGNPVFYPGYLGRLGEFRRNGAEGGGRAVVAGDYQYVSSVEGAVTSGTLAADRLIARLAAAD
jgi:oxygen-dependent protoporphyrinogen oxidase